MSTMLSRAVTLVAAIGMGAMVLTPPAVADVAVDRSPAVDSVRRTGLGSGMPSPFAKFANNAETNPVYKQWRNSPLVAEAFARYPDWAAGVERLGPPNCRCTDSTQPLGALEIQLPADGVVPAGSFISGTGTPDSLVALAIDWKPQFTPVRVDSTGHWKVRLSEKVTGSHLLVASSPHEKGRYTRTFTVK